MIDGGGEFRDRLHDADVIEFLQRAHVRLLEGALPADDEHGRLRPPRIGHGGDCVGGAGPGRDDGTASHAGEPGPGVGRVGGGLLVPDIDDLDAEVGAAFVGIDDVPAAEREDRADPGPKASTSAARTRGAAALDCT